MGRTSQKRFSKRESDNRARVATAVGEYYSKLKVDYVKILDENESLINEISQNRRPRRESDNITRVATAKAEPYSKLRVEYAKILDENKSLKKKISEKMGTSFQKRMLRHERDNIARVATAQAEPYSKLRVDYAKLLYVNESLRYKVECFKEFKVQYDKLHKENESLMNEVESLKETSKVGLELTELTVQFDKLYIDNESLMNEVESLKETSKVRLELTELKVQYDKLREENESLMNEVESLKEKTQTEDLYWPGFTSEPVVEFDPHFSIEFKPHLCPRFPERRETIPIDAGFAQTRVLKDILSHYDFKTSSPELYVPDLGLVSPIVAPSVVAVSSFFGLERKFDCSGLVIHWSSSENEATILTSAKLLWNPEDSDFEFHLIVRMADGTLLLAKEEHVDYYHNLLTLKVNSTVEPVVVDLRSRRADIVDGMKIISLSRNFNNSVLRDSIGELSLERPKFGCDELFDN